MDLLNDIEIPSPPQAALRLTQLCARPNSSIKEIVETISIDAALSAKLLKVANSAYYGQQYEVATLTRAAIVLGVSYVKVVALGFQLANMTKQWQDLPIDLRRIWQGNVLRACLARQIAFHSKVPAARCQEEAFLCGLLQDFAVPIVSRAVGELYVDFTGGGGLYTDERTVALENDAVDTNHAHLVGRIFDMWRLPPLLSFAMTNHHVRPQAVTPQDRALALWQIGYWVSSIPFSSEALTAPVGAEMRAMAHAAFGMDDETLSKAFYRGMEDYEAVSPMFSDMLPQNISGRSLLEQARELILDLNEAPPSDPFAGEPGD